VNNQELLNRYQQGERNFRRQNLSGLSLIGQNLAEADFSGANLRGARFDRSILKEANFTGVQVGLRKQDEIFLSLLFLIIVAILAIGAGLVGTLLNLELRGLTSAFEEITAGWAMVFLLLGFAILSVLEGLKSGFIVFAIAFLVAVSVAAVGPIVSTVINPIAFAVSSAIAIAITIVSSVTALTVSATILALSIWRSINLQVAILTLLTYGVIFNGIVYATNIVTSVVPVVPAVMLLTLYLGWRAFQGDPRQSQIRRLAVRLTTGWGTSFRNTDLTSADFSDVQLRNTHFEGANLTRVRWNPAQTDGAPAHRFSLRNF
jgi:uncharacterized protein YjbI with pentapeptide repeats